jgi:hypothetical protein
VNFTAIPSVPCFEFWLLLHFEDVLAPLHRTEVYQRLRQHIPGYDKGQAGHFAATQPALNVATQRAARLAALHDARDGNAPYTGVHQLVSLLTTLTLG